ncbi:hypothetical protein QEH52_19575 [Coraliomargarita sp. SDUM461003]|uniref:Uncharacterized protein n=1 Tax=Thalassobacterium maritimum TaxID=3041265 RepID=A0ABU1B014_9BACT|nr:hypothetical protein [Coraliomargarita sp. SDUM461003]MDQ8209728.1 hypothetical protein [Coraliomargarita sp. SDUM461003]
MKTFRWAIPEPELSSIEKHQHRSYEKRKGIKSNSIELDDLGVTPLNWRERWVLKGLRKKRSLWSAVPSILYAVMFTFLLSGHEEQKPMIWIFWIIAFLVIRETIESMAIRDILLRLKTKRSDQDATGQRR